jgi:parvulin-like peptidyl-prolyl isomerase
VAVPRLIRQFGIVAVAALSVSALAGCGEIMQNDAIAIGGSSVSEDYVDTIIEQLAAADQVQLVDGRIEGDALRSVLTAILRNEATHEFLMANDVSVTDQEREEVVTQYEEDPQFSLLGTELQELLISLNSQDLALARVKTPQRESLAAMYAKEPASLGVMCARHLLVDSESAARAAMKRVLDGEDFAAVAADVSTEPNASETGGALAGEDNDCLALGLYQEQFDNDFVIGALKAREATPSEPVKSSFGYHVIFIRPFDEVADSIEKSIAEQPGQYLLSGYLATSKVTVASRFGRWDPSVGQIIAN